MFKEERRMANKETVYDENIKQVEVDYEALKTVIGNNIHKLVEAMDWPQARFARETGIGPAALNNYINGVRLPGVDYLVNLTVLQAFKGRGILFSLNDLVSETFDPIGARRIHEGYSIESVTEIQHKDFLGNYICYYYDQAKPVTDQDFKLSRELRYGIITVYDDINGLTREVSVRIIGTFFKEKDYDAAVKLKNDLDSIFDTFESTYREKGKKDYPQRNEEIKKLYVSDDKSVYAGLLTFSDQHAFIQLECQNHGDNGFLVLYTPPKKATKEYVGGIGCAASVSHGLNHVPVAQKMIVSKRVLFCAREIIAKHLNMCSNLVPPTDESKDLVGFCKKLYSSESEVSRSFDDSDKEALVTRRLSQIVNSYAEKNITCYGSVSEEEDKAVYELIKRFS